MSVRGEVLRFARGASMTRLLPGDEILTPLGQPLYTEPRIELPGSMAFAYTISGAPVAVLVIRKGERSRLRYCDTDGRVREEGVTGETPEDHVVAASSRVAVLLAGFLGERHPLAGAVTANERPI